MMVLARNEIDKRLLTKFPGYLHCENDDCQEEKGIEKYNKEILLKYKSFKILTKKVFIKT